MDVDDELYLDLLALRELYILLLKTCFRDANSELLDVRAQMVLKHLLDDATAEVLEFHSKSLATDFNFYSFLHIDDQQEKPLDEKVVEWMEHNRNMGNSEIEHNPKWARASASNVAMSYLSNDISSALRRIELHILSLRHCTSQSRKARSHISELPGNETLNQQKVQQRTDHSTLRTRFTESIKGHNLSSQLRCRLVGGQNVKPIATNHCSEFVHGFRIPLSQDNDEAMKPPTVETHISKQHKPVNPTTPIDKSGCSVGSKATVRSGMKLAQARIQETRSDNSYGHMIMRPTLLDHHPSREVRKEQSHNKTHLTTQQESDFTNSESESVSSSSWATQQTSESETTDDPSSPSYQDGPPATDSEASSRYKSSSSSIISKKAFKFSYGKRESKRTIGRLQRLKNKLGLIFHHHHHHHHHHHPNSHNIMWKQLRKIFHRKDNRKLTSKEERYEGKVKKTAMRSVSRKNQVGKFQALAEGLRSHVWRSKAMKKKEVRGLNCGKKKKKKNGGKKLHWWKMFNRRHGVKLPNKGRVKIGYVNRKP